MYYTKDKDNQHIGVGDIIAVKNTQVKVLSVNKNDILVETKSGKKVTIDTNKSRSIISLVEANKSGMITNVSSNVLLENIFKDSSTYDSGYSGVDLTELAAFNIHPTGKLNESEKVAKDTQKLKSLLGEALQLSKKYDKYKEVAKIIYKLGDFIK